MRRKALLGLLVLCMLPVGGYASAFDALLQDANETHAALVTAEPLDISYYVEMDKHMEEELFTPALMKQLVTAPEDGMRPVSAAQAAEDVDILFRALRQAYGAYTYFGGDEAFGAAREAILQALDAQADTIEPKALAELIATELAFVQDCHFVVWKPLARFHFPYYTDALTFSPTDDGRWLLDGTAYQGINPAAQSIRPTILPTGEIGYGVYVLQEDTYVASTLERTLQFMDEKGNLREEPVTLTPAFSMPGAEGPMYEETRVNGVPVCTFRRMSTDAASTQSTLEAIAQSAASLQGEPVIVIDLRGNGGGNSVFPLTWVSAFAGRSPTPSATYAQKQSRLNQTAMLSLARSLGMSTDFLSTTPIGAPYWDMEHKTGEMLPNDSVLFVLIDKLVGSAAEDMVQYLQTLQNVVFVGTNTSGNMLCGNIGVIYLPNSGLPVQFGRNLNFVNTHENLDGLGFMPDLWVNPADAMDRVLRMIEQYGLTK